MGAPCLRKLDDYFNGDGFEWPGGMHLHRATPNSGQTFPETRRGPWQFRRRTGVETRVIALASGSKS